MLGNNRHKTELNLWVMPNAGYTTKSILQALIQEFEGEHPDTSVRLTVYPWSLGWSRLMEVVKGRYLGALPDVLQVGTTWVATLAHLGALERVPESNWLSDNEDLSTYIWDPGENNETGQELFCLPWFIDVRVLYYRLDLLDMLGLAPTALQDWSGFTQVCGEVKKFLSRSGPVPTILAPIALPGQKPGVQMHDLAPWIWAAGGDFCTPDLRQASLLDQPCVQGCEFYFDLIHHGFMPLSSPTLPQGHFFTGHYAMQFSGNWPLQDFLNPSSTYCARDVAQKFGVALLPAGPQGRFTFLGGSNLAVASVSQNKALAWELIRFLGTPARQLQHARLVGGLPPSVASMEPLFEKHPAAKSVFWASFAHARRLPRLIELGSIEQIILKMGARVLDLIRDRSYTHKRLYEEIKIANEEMNAVLSLHRYSGHGLVTGVP